MNRDPVVSFDLEKVEYISRPASVIYTIDASAVEEWKNAVINQQGCRQIVNMLGCKTILLGCQTILQGYQTILQGCQTILLGCKIISLDYKTIQRLQDDIARLQNDISRLPNR